jgi:tetratricopeptide (TPR) repeat protein
MAERTHNHQPDINAQNIGLIGDQTRIEGDFYVGGAHYHGLAPQKVDPDTLAQAQARLAELPLDHIPDPAPALPPGSYMPLGRNPLFVDREGALQALARTLRGRGTAAIGQLMAAATGLGGIGKTQLASEFVHRYGPYFAGGVFWLSLAEAAAVPAEIAKCGLRLHRDQPGYSQRPLAEQVAAVLAAWGSEMPRLLVFDNCEDETRLAQWRPPRGGCRVLVTGRRGQWSRELGVEALPLDVLPRPESLALLGEHRPDLAADEPLLDDIAAELGDLPLALHLAGSFLARYRHAVAPEAYLAQLWADDLLRHPSLQGRGTDYSATGHDVDVGRTFALSYDRLRTDDPTDALALALLSRAACFAPGEPVPRDLLLATLDLPPDDPEAPLRAEDALARLVALGLLESEADGALRLHRLLVAFVRQAAPEAGAQEAVEAALLAQADRLNQAGYPAPLLAWQAHLRAVTDRAAGRGDERGAGLCNTLGYHLDTIADYEAAWPYYERALAIKEQVLGAEHPATATGLNNLGALWQAIGDYEAARPYLERALAIRQQVLGAEHPTTAQSLNNLGALLVSMGDYEAARPYLERALAIDRQVLGEDHPTTAFDLNNLGVLFDSMGDYEAARPYFEHALAIDRQVLGEDHPTTAFDLNNLGGLFYNMGEYEAARPYYERALAITEQVLGAEHPTTALSLNNLGLLLKAMGDYEAARPYFERALAIREKVLGAEHPDTANSLNNLGFLWQAMGDYAAARPYYERALAILEARLGPDHPHARTVRENLARLARELGEA